jgi:phospholipase A1
MRVGKYFALCVLFSPITLADEAPTPYQSCLIQKIESAPSGSSVDEIKQSCQQRQKIIENSDSENIQTLEEDINNGESLVAQRIKAEKATRKNPFVISPHKQNYVLTTYNADPNYKIYNMSESDFDRWEIKFQLSYKMPVIEGILGSDLDLYAAYTNLSYWQAFNRDISSPFRETNHEPELFLVVPDIWHDEWEFHGWRSALMQFGVVHQSNGQGGYRSRSWNRLYANILFEKNNLLVAFKPWYRLPEDNDDNPKIDDYLGRYEIYGIYKKRKQTFSLMLRNLFDGEDRDTVQLDWSLPLYGRWRGYLQYFYGYGESLIDYDAKSHRLGLGVQLTDWL